MHMCIHAFQCKRVYVYYMCVYIYIYMCVCVLFVFSCVCVYRYVKIFVSNGFEVLELPEYMSSSRL